MPVLVIADKKYPYKYLGQWSNKDGMLIQQTTGLKWGAFVDGVNDGDLEALTAFVWAIRRRNGENALRYGDVEFAFDDLSIELTDEEQAEAARLVKEQETAEADPTPAGSPPSARKTRASRGSGTKASSS